MELDDAIKLCKNSSIEEVKQLHVWLTDLKTRYQSDLRPAYKYLGNSPGKQLVHVLSEVVEVSVEFLKYRFRRRNKLAEEIVDLQMSCETLLAIIGVYWSADRNYLRRMVIAKNEARHYYE